MPSALTYPGAYIEAVPSGVRTISGAAASITGFVGSTGKGTSDMAQHGAHSRPAHCGCNVGGFLARKLLR